MVVSVGRPKHSVAAFQLSRSQQWHDRVSVACLIQNVTGIHLSRRVQRCLFVQSALWLRAWSPPPRDLNAATSSNNTGRTRLVVFELRHSIREYPPKRFYMAG